MAGLGLVSCDKEEGITNGLRKGQDLGWYVDAKDVIGRDEDKKVILKMLFNGLDDEVIAIVPVVIAIVGIGGMGKTALSQLIYNDDEVKKNFENRWFACISDISDEKEVLGKIFQSICGKNYSGFTMNQLQTNVRGSIEGKKFLLVLDDVWDENHDRWLKRIKLLNCGAKGSKIIVTTRSSLVATATDALETHKLGGLSEDHSWDLFKRLAFAPGFENDARRIELGREIMKKCVNVPLAIRSIGSLLFEKNTIQEWELIRDEELPNLGRSHEDDIMPVLKLSYDHLSSNLKQCFAYCSLFPKDYDLYIRKLIYLWISQGYIKQNNEDAGYSDFMYLLRRGFFQEAEEDAYGNMISCKMHDLIHDLAQHVAGEESIMLMESSNTSNCARHVSSGGTKIDVTWAIPASLINASGLRSCILIEAGSIGNLTLPDQLFTNFKRLRTLWLMDLEIENVPNSIGELKHLRYLDLSHNKFESLPDSMTNLLNLLTLDIQGCRRLKALPGDLRKLINLRCLNIRHCDSLMHLPAGIGEMTSLQHLSDFKVRRRSIEEKEIEGSGLDQLAGLEQLRGRLSIKFEDGVRDWDDDECWQLPQVRLEIENYPGRRIPRWGNNGRENNLASLDLRGCKNVKYLPPLRCLPNLRFLYLQRLQQLEYVEGGDSCKTEVLGSSSFFPRLERLSLSDLPKLKGWWSEVATPSSMFLSFPLLCRLDISKCPQPKSIPLCPFLQQLRLWKMDGNEVLSNSSHTSPTAPPSSSASSIQHILNSPLLRKISIAKCDTLEVMHLATPNLQILDIWSCQRLNKLHIVHPNVIEELYIYQCPELDSWKSQDKRCVDWDSLSKLRILSLIPLPPLEQLPSCLRHRQSHGHLKINTAVSDFSMLKKRVDEVQQMYNKLVN